MLGARLRSRTRARNGGRRPLAAQIRALFAQGEQGVWYDPSDLSTLFQDAAGTTPVTAVGQPVGLMLDKSRGLVLGPELIANGTFDVDLAGWTDVDTGTGSSQWNAAGYLELTGVDFNNRGRREQVITTVVGKAYRIAFDKVVGAGVNLHLIVHDTVVLDKYPQTAIGAYSYVFTATAVNTVLKFSAFSAGTVGIDNISVRELPGNHASQPTATCRPLLQARYNLLTKTERFDDAYWSKAVSDGVTSWPVVTANYATAPNGTNTACRVQLTAPTNTEWALVRVNNTAISIPANTPFTDSVYLKANGPAQVGKKVSLYAYNTTSSYYGVVGSLTLTEEWQHFEVEQAFPVASTAQEFSLGKARSTAQGQNGTTGILQAETATDFLVWGAQRRFDNDGVNLPPYQRVNTATDYDTAGFPHYLAFDGIDDFLATPSIDFTATDKMTVFAGLRKLSDATLGMVCELSADTNVTAGSFYLTAPHNPGVGNTGFLSKGSSGGGSAVAGGVNAPISCVLTGSASITPPTATHRLNGAHVSSSNNSQGTGNFGNHPLYLGRRGGTSLPFNGHIYGLCIVGKRATDAQIRASERYLAQRTGVSL